MQYLETKRLLLREVTTGDFGFLGRLMSEDGYIAAVGDLGIRTSADAERYVQSAEIYKYDAGLGFNIVELQDAGAQIGICGLVQREETGLVELGYGYLKAAHGKGFGTEAATVVVSHGFEQLRLRNLFAITNARNNASRRLLEKIGMTLSHMSEELECVYRMDAGTFLAHSAARR